MKRLPDLPITDEEIPMLAQGWRQQFMDFTTGYDVPNRFEHYLFTNGYKPAEGTGLLLSACGNVHFHTDDARLSAVWVLAAHYQMEEHKLVTKSTYEPMVESNVFVFNPSYPHAVMADANLPYLLYVLNVRKI